MEFTVTFTRTFRTDDADPICDADDIRVVDWFAGYGGNLLLDDGWGVTVTRDKDR